MRSPPDRHLIVDNGAHELKIGYADSATATMPIVMPNAVMKAKTDRKRVFVGGEIDECRDRSSLFYMLPMQRGYVVNLDTQQKVWDYAFGAKCLNVPCSSTTITMTEPLLNFRSIGDDIREILFEAYNFGAVRSTTSAALCAASFTNCTPSSLGVCCVVDSGYSFTHVVPVVGGKIVRNAVVRVDVGGKLLTNQLKEMVSYRQLVVMDETYVMNECKHDLAYVAQDFNVEMKRAMYVNQLKRQSIDRQRNSSIVRDYVLPDYTTRHRGEVRESSSNAKNASEQIIRLSHERFSVPELLFRPSNVGIEQMGIAEATAHAIGQCAKEVQDRMYANVIVTGGNCAMDGFVDRLCV